MAFLVKTIHYIYLNIKSNHKPNPNPNTNLLFLHHFQLLAIFRFPMHESFHRHYIQKVG